MNTDPEQIHVYRISAESLRERTRNIFWGMILSLALVGVLEFERYRDPDNFNDALRRSVVIFLILANGFNYYRHRRYLRLTRDHRVEIHPGRVQFWTGGAKTELDIKDVAAMTLYRRRRNKRLGHIQLRLKNSRGIRLEGYEDLEGLAARLAEQIPKAHILEPSI